jgi:hypothetical protein
LLNGLGIPTNHAHGLIRTFSGRLVVFFCHTDYVIGFIIDIPFSTI